LLTRQVENLPPRLAVDLQAEMVPSIRTNRMRGQKVDMENGDFFKILQIFSDGSANKGKKGGQFVLELITE
jgi:hypothetical protein